DITMVVRPDVERHESRPRLFRMPPQEAVEEALPCLRMHARSLREHAIEVEEHRVEVARREHDNLAGTRHGTAIRCGCNGFAWWPAVTARMRRATPTPRSAPPSHSSGNPFSSSLPCFSVLGAHYCFASRHSIGRMAGHPIPGMAIPNI